LYCVSTVVKSTEGGTNKNAMPRMQKKKKDIHGPSEPQDAHHVSIPEGKSVKGKIQERPTQKAQRRELKKGQKRTKTESEIFTECRVEDGDTRG